MEPRSESESWLYQHKGFVRLGMIFIFLTLLGFIIYASFLVTRLPNTGFAFSWLRGDVGYVTANTPAAEAGIQPGDIILIINGHPRIEAIRDYALLTNSVPVTLSFLRNGTVVSTELYPVPPMGAELRKRLLTLAVALIFAVFSFYLWAHQPYSPLVILYFLVNQFGAAVLIFGSLSALALSWANLGFMVSLGLIAPLLVHFHLRLVRVPAISWWRPLLAAAYTTAILLILWQRSYFALPLDPGKSSFAYNALLLYFVIAIAFSAALLIYNYIYVPGQRIHTRLLAVGTLVAFLPLITLAIIPQAIAGIIFVPYEWTFSFLLFLPLTYAIAIRTHGLLSIEQDINRGVVHLIALVFLMIGVLMLVATVSYIWPTIWLDQPILWGIFTLLLVIVFSPLRAQLQTRLDHFLYGGWYGYQAVIDEVSQGLSQVYTAEELAHLLVNRLTHLLRLKAAALFLRDDQNNNLALVQSAGFTGLPAQLTGHGLLATKLGQSGVPSLPITLQIALGSHVLSPEEQQCYAVPGIGMWVPLVRNKNLQGILLLGSKFGSETFDDIEDEQLLTTLAYDAAIAAENVRLVRTVLQHADEVKNLYAKLVQSREEERKRLSRELHDQVIQDLINLHYYLTPTASRTGVEPENLKSLRERVELIINTLREICTELRPAALDDLTLELAFRGFIDEQLVHKDMPYINFQVLGDEEALGDSLSEETKVCLFRILQETIANVHRHAQATKAQITLTFAATDVTLQVSDNGRGFICPPGLGSFTRDGHFGLTGLQERVHLLGGIFQVESTIGKGTTVITRLPLLGLQDFMGSNLKRDI